MFDHELLDACLSRLQRPLRAGKSVEELAREPVLFHIEYADGLRANVLTLNGAVAEWSVAWRDEAGDTESTLFWTQEARPFMHFTYLLAGIEKMFQTGKPAWPVERTLMTSGLLDALLISKQSGGERLSTPHLQFSYQSDWDWRQPPEPPPGRPVNAQ
jgi:hypothetical protein